MAQQRDRNWNFDNDEDLLYGYMGSEFKNTDEDIARIAAAKAAYEAPHVRNMLDLQSNDVVVDLGSGYGHIAKVIAPEVAAYHCCDISSKMLEKCRASTAGIENISYHVVGRCDLKDVVGVGVTKIFANSVFIHLGLFDITLYLEEFSKVLLTGGVVYFNFQDSDVLAMQNDPNFFSMRNRYVADPQEITLMHWNSMTCIRGYAKRCGFELKRSYVWKNASTSLTLQKVA
jgi:cyclopropane fatty-acyl-phospholipid synthase-like methyltransferase